MDPALLTAIAALVSAAAGVAGGNVIGAYRARREFDRLKVTDAVDAANALRDDMLEQIKEMAARVRDGHARVDTLSSIIDAQRAELTRMNQTVIECERRGLKQAEEVVHLKAMMITAGVKLPIDGLASPSPAAPHGA